MGRTTYPCPGCGQAQTQEHPNGEEVALAPCAACKEVITQEISEILGSKASKKEQLTTISLTLRRFGAPEADADNAARLYYAQAHPEGEKGAAVH